MAADRDPGNDVVAAEAAGRAWLEAAEHSALGLIVEVARLWATEPVMRAKLHRQAMLLYRPARKQLLLGVQQLVRREVLAAQECLERLEAEHRWDLIGHAEGEHACLWWMATQERGLWAGLQLQEDEAEARAGLWQQEEAAAADVGLAAEPLWRLTLEAEEGAGWEGLLASWQLQRSEAEDRQAVEAQEREARPDPAGTLLLVSACRGRAALRGLQVLQRQELGQRWRLLRGQVELLEQCRQQCLAVAVAKVLASLQQQQLQQRKLVVATERTQRALVTVHREAVLHWQEGRTEAAKVEAAAYSWLRQYHGCVAGGLAGRAAILAEEEGGFAQLLQQAWASSASCSQQGLEAEEADGRRAVHGEWQESWRMQVVMLEALLRWELLARQHLTATWEAHQELNAVERAELESRHRLATGALKVAQGMAENAAGRQAVWRELEAGRQFIVATRESQRADQRRAEWVAWEPLRRAHLEGVCLQQLRLAHACWVAERLEYTERRAIRIEEVRLSTGWQAWLGLTTALEHQRLAARRALAEVEGGEWQALLARAAIDRKMAKLTMEVRTGKEARLKMLGTSHKRPTRNAKPGGRATSTDPPGRPADASPRKAPGPPPASGPPPGPQPPPPARGEKSAKPRPSPEQGPGPTTPLLNYLTGPTTPPHPVPTPSPPTAPPPPPPLPSSPPVSAQPPAPRLVEALTATPRTRLRAASLALAGPAAAAPTPVRPPPLPVSAPAAPPGRPEPPTLAPHASPTGPSAGTEGSGAAMAPKAAAPPAGSSVPHPEPAVLAPVVAAAARADSAAALEVDDLVAQALQLMAAGQKGEARHYLAQAIRQATAMPPGSFEENQLRLASLGDALNNLGCLDWQLGHLAAADDSLRLAAAAQRQAYGRPLSSTLVNHCYLSLAGTGDTDAAILHATAAIEALDDDLAIPPAAPAPPPPEPRGQLPPGALREVQVYAWLGLGLAQWASAAPAIRAGAEGSLATAVEVGHRCLGPDHPATLHALRTFHDFLVPGAQPRPPAPRQAWGSQRQAVPHEPQPAAPQRKSRPRPLSGPSRTRNTGL